MVNSISYSLYSVKALSDLAKQMYDLLQEAYPKHPMLSPFVDSLQKAYLKGLDALGENKGSSITSEIKASDADRDAAYVSLRNHIKAGIGRLNEPYNQAAQTLYRVFEENNLRLYDFRYAEQSAALARLFSDLQKPENQAALKTLNALEWLDELQQAQAQFEKLYAQRNTETASIEKTTDQEAKKELSTALQLVLQTLGVLEATRQPEGIQETVKKINVVINQAQTAARR